MTETGKIHDVFSSKRPNPAKYMMYFSEFARSIKIHGVFFSKWPKAAKYIMYFAQNDRKR